jgi:filamentous hemagglutinin family protein
MATFIAPKCNRLALLVAFSAITFLGHRLEAAPTSIALDGSLGAAGPVNGVGNIFTITPGMGKAVGPNLFQSFGTFNLGAGDTAAFQAGGASNIIARVTGGSASSIDGTLTSPVNLFFINPAGVMFGANAQVNVTGAFVVSTANYAKLGDGNIFYADVNHPISDQGLTSAPVSAFGFLTATPQPVTFTGSHVGAQFGSQPATAVTGIHVIGGDISLDDAKLQTPGGELTLFSAASAGEVPFSLMPSPTQYSTAATTVTKFGNITVANQSQVEIDGNGGGSMVIRGGKITVDTASDVTSGNFAGVGGNIAVQADDLSIANAAFIGTQSFDNAGDVGSITVNVADELSISGAVSQISSVTETAGNSGDVSVTAGTIDLNGGSIFSVPDIGSSGHGGIVTVSAQSMTMEGGGRVSSFTGGSGDAGTVQLTLAGSLTMSGAAAIAADTYGSGNGGDVDITAQQITMSEGAFISANTALSSGKGGDVNIRTDSLSIQGVASEPPKNTGISADGLAAVPYQGGPLGTGNAGVISVSATNLSLSSGAVISSASANEGNGGSVAVACAEGQLSGLSQISASSANTNAGSVQVNASDSFTLSSGSSVNTSAALNGGIVTLRIGRLLYLNSSNIQAFAGVASTPGQQVGGNGGNITIDPLFVILDNSFISANALSGTGMNGNIINSADFFFSSDSFLHATGTIDTTAPDLDLANSLVVLPGNLIDVQNKLRESCARSVNHEFSTLIVTGRGGTEAAPEELQSDFGPR